MKKGGLPEEVMGDLTGTFMPGVNLPRQTLGAGVPPDQTEGSPTPPIVEERISSALDDAANLILSQLTPSIREYATELADIVLKVPRWQLVLGAVLAQYESGSLPNIALDPGWRQIEITVGDSTCQECQQKFTPKRMGQKFCSNKCGSLSQRRVIDEMKKKNAALNSERRVAYEKPPARRRAAA
jgi:hypothetical protein